MYKHSCDSHRIPTWTDEPAGPPILQVCAAAGWPLGWRHSPPPLALTPSPSSSPSPGLTAPANAKALSISNTRHRCARIPSREYFSLFWTKITKHENQREILGDFYQVPYFILHCFIYYPSELQCVGNAGIKPGGFATFAVAVRQENLVTMRYIAKRTRVQGKYKITNNKPLLPIRDV